MTLAQKVGRVQDQMFKDLAVENDVKGAVRIRELALAKTKRVKSLPNSFAAKEY